MEKFFNVLAKPARWILIIGSLVYATWFAIEVGCGINGKFINVMSNLIILFVGTALLCAVPILVLFKQDDKAKIVFLLLVGYFLIDTTLDAFGGASGLTGSEDGLMIATGVFLFIFALGLVGILVMIALEFALNKSIFRFIAVLILLGVIAFGFLSALFLMINSGRMDAFWPDGLSYFFKYLCLPVIIFFGYIHFFGAPKAKKKAK